MRSNQIFTKRSLELDNSVWRTMIILCILAIILLAYTTLKKEEFNCADFKFKILGRTSLSGNASYYYSGENISFTSSLAPEKGNSILWLFNDGSPDTTKGYFVRHKFEKGGVYRITAYINEECSFDSTVTIADKPREVKVRDTFDIQILGEPFTVVGKPEEYSSPVNASSYEWTVLGNDKMNKQIQNERKALFNFGKGGNYIIQLKLDNSNSKTYRKNIIVQDLPKQTFVEQEDPIADVGKLPRVLPPPPKELDIVVPPSPKDNPEPEPPKPEAPKIKHIDDDSFKDELQEFVNNEREEKDFDRYLCSTGTTRVIINNENDEPLTFTTLCQKLRKKKKTIKNVQLRRENGCVTRIDIKI